MEHIGYTGRLLFEVGTRTKTRNYSDLAFVVGGNTVERVVDICTVLYIIGNCIRFVYV